MICAMAQTVPSAIFLWHKKQEEWPIWQRTVLSSRGTVTCWINVLIGTSQSLWTRSVKSCIWGQTTLCTKTCWGHEMESSSAEKDLEVLVDTKLDMSQQCTLSAKKTKHILDFIRQSTGSRLRLSSAKETWAYWKESIVAPMRWQRDWRTSPVRKVWGSYLGLCSLEETQRNLINVHKYLKDRTRFFSVVPSDGTRGNRQKL